MLPSEAGGKILSLLDTSSVFRLLSLSRGAQSWIEGCLPYLDRLWWKTPNSPPLERVCESICRVVKKYSIFSVRQIEGSLAKSHANVAALADLLICQPLLRHLSLTELPTLDSHLAGLLVQKCVRISSLSLPGCRTQSLTIFEELMRNFTHLREVDLGFCQEVGDNAMCEIARQCRDLRSIKLDKCPVTDRAVISLGHYCPRLRALYVNRCRTLTDTGILAVSKGCYNLELLACRECRGISDRSIVTLLRRCGQLHTVQISNTSCELSSLPHRTALQRIDLASCRMITDESLHDLSEACPLLESLNVGFCGLITEDGVTAIVKKCLRLRELLIPGLRLLTDVALCATVADFCPQLCVLNMGLNTHFTDHGLILLVSRCTKLKELYIGYCPQLTDTSVRILLSCCRNLKVFHCQGCELLSAKPLLELPPENFSKLNDLCCSEQMYNVLVPLLDLNEMKEKVRTP